MTKNSLTGVLETLDEIKTENPKISEEFIDASRKFWAAKYDLWFCRNGSTQAAEENYPWMSSFKTYEDFRGVYSALVHDALKDQKSRGLISEEDLGALKRVSKRFSKIAPEDPSILPIVEEEADFITAKPVLILPYGNKISFYICEVGGNYDNKETRRDT